MTKQCRCCGVEKTAGEFYPRGSNKKGLRSDCKQCQSEQRTNHWRRSVGKRVVTRVRYQPREPQPVPCPKGCHGMAWRVVGSVCRHCGLARAPERVSRPELWRGGNLTRAIDEMGFHFDTGRKAS